MGNRGSQRGEDGWHGKHRNRLTSRLWPTSDCSVDTNRFFESPVRRHTRLYRMPSSPWCVFIRLAQDHNPTQTLSDSKRPSHRQCWPSLPVSTKHYSFESIVPISTKDIDSPSTRSITTVAATDRTLLCRPKREGAEREPFGTTCPPTVYMTPNSDSAELDMAISSLSVPPASFSTFHPWSE